MAAQPKRYLTNVAVLAISLAGCTGLPARVDSLLTAGDRALIATVTQESLETGQTGESSNWRNDESDHGGNVTPLRTYTGEANRPCRDIQQTVAIDGRTTIAYDSACRQAEGTWISLNYDSLSGAIAAAELNANSAYRRPYPYNYGPYPYNYRPYPYYYRPYPYYYGAHPYYYGRSPYRYRYRPHFGFRFGYGHRYGYPYRHRRYYH